MFKLEINDKPLVASLSALEKKQLPFATMLALNDSMFDVHKAWAGEVAQVFDQPTPATQKAALYKKATKNNLVAEVFLRDEASKGTPPVRWLEPQAEPGPRTAKPFEFLLRQAGVLGDDEYVVPTRLAPTDAYGNVPGSLIKTILADLQASRNVDARSTPETRAKRARRKNIGKRGVFFYSRGPGSFIRGVKEQHLPRGIYMRTAFGSGSQILMVFVIVKGAPTYGLRFDAYGLAQTIFSESFPRRFNERMRFALRTAKIR